MSYYLAIDAGGTKADLALADDTRVLARVRTGSLKRMRVDATTAAANLDRALQSLSSQTGLSMIDVSSTCIGTAGETVPLVTDWLRDELSRRIGGKLILLGDVEIALDAAFRGQPGVLVMAGTGSNVAGRDRFGRLTTAGGWGPALADYGSGHRIGHQALRSIFAAIDRGTPTALLAAVLKAWELETIDQLVTLANRTPSPDLSLLAPVVLACAEQRDRIASRVLEDEGEALAELVLIVTRRTWSASEDSSQSPASLPKIALTGSILEHMPPLRGALLGAIRRGLSAATIVEGIVDPLEGALWRARRGN